MVAGRHTWIELLIGTVANRSRTSWIASSSGASAPACCAFLERKEASSVEVNFLGQRQGVEEQPGPRSGDSHVNERFILRISNCA
jgi:hypothetical protein